MFLFVEDPGAAAYAAGVPAALAQRGLFCRTVAGGHAADLLRSLDVEHETIALADLGSAFESAQPGALAVGTAENRATPGLLLVDAARRQRIPSVGLVDGPANPAYRFRGTASSALAHAPDWIAVPDESTRRRFVALGMAEDRVRACGHPAHDRARRERGRRDIAKRRAAKQTLWPAAGERAVLVFAAEISAGIDHRQFVRSADYTWAGPSGSDRRTEIVIEEFLLAAGALHPRSYLVLRLHAKTSRAMFASYLSGFDAVSEGGPAMELIGAADGIVGLTSVILDEAAVMGCPALSIVPRRCEREWLIGASLGVSPVATARGAIGPALAGMVADRGMADTAALDRMLPRDAAANVAGVIAAARHRSAA